MQKDRIGDTILTVRGLNPEVLDMVVGQLGGALLGRRRGVLSRHLRRQLMGATVTSKFRQTWAKSYSSTTCREWSSSMTNAQQWAASDMLAGARNQGRRWDRAALGCTH